ncbi:hypothetical protein PROFUN_16754, partial [Planoprotostelium fungivorum]
ELLEEKEKEYAAEVKRVQVEGTSKTMSLELQLEEIQDNRAKGQIYHKANDGSTIWQEVCSDFPQDCIKCALTEIKRVQVECTSKTMSLELQLEEMLKTIEQKDKFITKQMMSLEKYKAHDIACFTFQVQQAGKRKVCTKHAQSRYKEKHKAHNNACLTTLWFSKQAGDMTTETQDTRPTHKPLLVSASMRHRLLSFTYKCFAENLQTDHRRQAFKTASPGRKDLETSVKRFEQEDFI